MHGLFSSCRFIFRTQPVTRCWRCPSWNCCNCLRGRSRNCELLSLVRDGWYELFFQTSAALLTIILSLLMYPDIQRKCQEEIDSVIVDRLPTMEDRASLPYLNAFICETQRWRPVLPYGVPHIPSKDDVYGNYFIPKGSLVITNTWWIYLHCHDGLAFDWRMLYFIGTFSAMKSFMVLASMNLTRHAF